MSDTVRQFSYTQAALIIALALSTGCAQPATSTTNPFAQPSPNFSNPWNSPPPTVPTTPPPTPPPNTPGLPPPPGVAYPTPGAPTTPPASRRGRPNWSNPGSMNQQQARAVRFDPFADNEAGPEIVGGRPLSYMKQQPAAVRATEFLNPLSPF